MNIKNRPIGVNGYSVTLLIAGLAVLLLAAAVIFTPLRTQFERPSSAQPWVAT